MTKFLLPILLFASLSNAGGSKFNFQLEQAINAAQTAEQDLHQVFILGIIRTSAEIDTAEKAFSLFKDKNTKIRAFIPSPNGSIVTFMSSLSGVLNAAESSQVFSIQMSQRLIEN